MIARPDRLVVVAPTWLGDAVMALPLVADLHREWSDTHLTVAGRPPVAALFEMVDDVDDVIVFEGRGGIGAVRVAARSARALRHGNFDAALLLPNSFVSAWIAFSAAIPERWGFRSDLRGPLLTRALARPAKNVHQATYYQTLASALGLVPGPPYARVTVSADARTRAHALLESAGLERDAGFVAMAPGAAYGRAKQWLPERYAELARLLAGERSLRSVLIGSRADAAVCGAIASAATGTIDLAGRTDLPALAAVLSLADAVVANDSGAMHLAAAVGARVVAVFGSTNEKKTAPLAFAADRPAATVVATNVWCRPCMLRECPIDHRCMTGIQARDVFDKLL
jgi:lipopolysaccharide heptosyltransferase II